jgi:hypothetical protein
VPYRLSSRIQSRRDHFWGPQNTFPSSSLIPPTSGGTPRRLTRSRYSRSCATTCSRNKAGGNPYLRFDHVSKETYYRGKRDLLYKQTRPSIIGLPEPSTRLFAHKCQKRPATEAKESDRSERKYPWSKASAVLDHRILQITFVTRELAA